MSIFRQLGDPLAAAECLCQHHIPAYAEFQPGMGPESKDVYYEDKAANATVTQVAITTTETCCIVVNAASIVQSTIPVTIIEIERPLGTIRTQQEGDVSMAALKLLHHAAWEVLPAGTYTYYLVSRAGYVVRFYGAWIKAIASDCEG